MYNTKLREISTVSYTHLDVYKRQYMDSLYTALGVFLPLIVVNCIILGRAEMFACIPGAGQMYQGYMKRGLSLITMFCLFIILGLSLIHIL